ncbi:zinc-ribbon and DUF3426 domain-containing protein [Variovorax sp. J22P271]|uniref:zinc-ribbon and DUF3426 domain-containing protein n=1 Tax=Variovorax davisae TaxID=3053515 RepID=UPI0025780BB3|nr:zinc-ribbon and DUF3426 domain-containing protein [Variovorax sp. J22P271]MDM0031432.1 zinc-ribbon and DUF3426 domain-containing protein [Variovorax sp. J22P271]
MSLVTRCPACDTTFKVVRDQLRISDGWVRCGRCSQVFDATVDLQEAPQAPSTPVDAAPEPMQPDPGEPPPHVEAEPEPEPAAAAAVEAAGASGQGIAESDFFDDEQASGPAPLTPAGVFSAASPMAWPDADSLLLGDQGRTAVRPPVPPPLAFPDIDLTLPSRPALASAGAPPEADDSGHMQLEKALRRARVKSAKIARAKAKEQAAAVAELAPVVQAASDSEPGVGGVAAASGATLHAEPVPAFLGLDEAQAGWRRPAVRRSLVAAAVLAALLLLAQVLHQERDLIAARQPALRPLLDALCGVTGCTLTALRQINDIKIDGASFARDKEGDGFHLGFTVRNSATMPLAMPAVELSLLDTQERAVVRRVLMPSDFGAPPVLPARAERSASLALRLSGAEAASMPPVAGFRLEALYP